MEGMSAVGVRLVLETLRVMNYRDEEGELAVRSQSGHRDRVAAKGLRASRICWP